jgi:hypothetical protein
VLKVVLGFIQGIGTLAKPWWFWIGFLMVINMVVPWFFIGTMEAKVVLVATIIAAMLQMSIFRFKGFVRLLGLGHIPWLPVVVWLASRLGEMDIESPFGIWILSVVVLDGISLIIDFIDVGRYFLGDREPSFVLRG